MNDWQDIASDEGVLLHNIVLFGRLLRALGLDINPGRMIDLVDALSHIEIGRKTDFYHTARSLLVHDKQDIAVFDQAFELFWQKPAREGVTFPLANVFDDETPPPDIMTPPQPDPEQQESPLNEEEPEEEVQKIIEVTRTFSTRERLASVDFGEMTAVEIELIKRFMSELVWELGHRRTRRKRPATRSNLLDLRRALRRNIRYGSELLEWPRRQIKIKPRPVVIIADISGSMEQYTRLLLHFIYGLAGSLQQPVESFVFSTRLTRITRQLRHKNLETALREVSSEVNDWSGGTRIGDALKTFNFKWGRRVLGRGAVVLLISDGWDRGEPKLLRDEMARLQRNVYRLIWLNPLLGSERYEPLTRGMQAALPYIDDFLPVHNLNSLEDLADHLVNLTAVRRQNRRKKRQLAGAAFIK